MAGKLTSKQEAFAYAVGFENKNYTEAYREIYTIKPGTLARTIWNNASKLANKSEVSARIDDYKKQRRKEISRSITWDYQQAERAAKRVLGKNMNDLVRAEVLRESSKQATNNAIIESIKILNDIYEKSSVSLVGNESNSLIDAQIKKLEVDTKINRAKLESIMSDKGKSTEDKLDELLGKISEVIDDK